MPLHSTLSSIDHYRAVGPVLRLAIPAAGRQETLSAIQSPSVSLALLLFEVLANPKSALKTPTNTRLDDEQFFWRQRGVASSRVDVIREVLPDRVVFYFVALDPNVDLNLGITKLVTQAFYLETVLAHHALGNLDTG